MIEFEILTSDLASNLSWETHHKPFYSWQAGSKWPKTMRPGGLQTLLVVTEKFTWFELLVRVVAEAFGELCSPPVQGCYRVVHQEQSKNTSACERQSCPLATNLFWAWTWLAGSAKSLSKLLFFLHLPTKQLYRQPRNELDWYVPYSGPWPLVIGHLFLVPNIQARSPRSY